MPNLLMRWCHGDSVTRTLLRALRRKFWSEPSISVLMQQTSTPSLKWFAMSSCFMRAEWPASTTNANTKLRIIQPRISRMPKTLEDLKEMRTTGAALLASLRDLGQQHPTALARSLEWGGIY